MAPPDLIHPDPSEEIVGLIAQAQRRLFAFLLTLVRRPADVDDILQETNVVLWRKRATYQLGTDFFAWAYEIARLQALAFHARRAPQGDPFDNVLLDRIADTARAESALFNRREDALRVCLGKLPEIQRNLILRRYQPEVEVQALAMEMGKSAKAVSESLRRIRECLRQCIERTLSLESRS